MKKILMIFGLIILVLIGGFLFVSTKEKKIHEAIVFENVDLGQIDNGQYIGSYASLLIAVEVEVTVKDHMITDIIITKHNNGKGTPAEIIVEDIINAQSTQVDSISGATYSSDIIKKAVENALIQN
ncbi:MAG: FMN-binding protein [Clostridia bacterium]|nr:FMN-binding protein [Clostridia bacterium]